MTDKTTGPEWGQSFVFDGFGNLTQQVQVKGQTPPMSMTVDATKNRLTGTGITYDAAGNLLSDSVRSYSYDVFGRLSGTAGESYVYDPRNQRVLINKANGTKEVNVYGVDGLLYQVWSWNGTAWSRVAAKERIYFGGRLIMVGGEKVVTDRLGSVVRKGTTNMAYYPYGQERTSTPNDTAKFGTYTRDAATGLDYAMNRYYQSTWGRFTSPDPYLGSASPETPSSWNRYSYVGGDPANATDSTGLIDESCANPNTFRYYGAYLATCQAAAGGGSGAPGEFRDTHDSMRWDNVMAQFLSSLLRGPGQSSGSAGSSAAQSPGGIMPDVASRFGYVDDNGNMVYLDVEKVVVTGTVTYQLGDLGALLVL